jgi:hypothetical protein
MEIEKHMAPLGSVSEHTKHLLPYVLDTKEMVSFTHHHNLFSGTSE